MAARGIAVFVIGRWITVVSALAIALATLLPEPGGKHVTHWCVIFCGDLSGVDAVLNVLLFLPLGIGLALWRVRAWTAVAAMISFSVVIESLQLFLAGRHASVADVITNSLGGILGFVIGYHGSTLLRPRVAIAGRLAASWLGIWIGIQLVVAYCLIPVPSDPPYYSQIGRPHWRSQIVFPGKVLSATLGGLELLTRGELPNEAQLKTLLELRDGAPLQVAVKPAGISPGRSEIIVVAGEGTGVVSLEQEGADVILSVRTGADALMLRPLEFRLRDVFRDSMSAPLPDTVLLHARYARSLIELGARSRGTVREWQFIPRLSDGWRLLTPYQGQIEGDIRETLASAAFMAMLMLPTGYWGRFADQASDKSWRVRRRIALVAGLTLSLVVGLVAVPFALGLRPAAIWEWGACLAGIAIGMVIASATRASEVPG